ncbi:prolyl oligopeptidase family serine peptidase, partial [uncultured Oxalicibacterium sp.]|uniref:alpha/beta hydrolase family esterase n=1 Tax=uncultured Oxalicibacterium sp. TaxID=1168540 RepID=UPI0025FA499D
MPFSLRYLVPMLLSSLLCSHVAAEERLRLRDVLKNRAAETAPDAQERTLTSSGASRSYVMLDASRGKPAPLIVALHGGGGTGMSMIQRWRNKARNEGLIVVALNGVGRTRNAGTWNAGGCCGEAMQTDSEDVRFVADVIDAVSRTNKVDPDRIYVTGMSNGGMLTHRVAIALSHRLAGAAVVAGAMFGDEMPPIQPVPMLILHGMADSVVPFDGGKSPTRFVARAQSEPFKPAQYAVDFWRRANGCTPPPSVSTQGDVRLESSTDCRGGSAVQFYRLTSADHT